MTRWTEQFFKAGSAASSGKLALNTAATKYYGGEQRSTHTAGNSLVIAFPGSDYNASSPEISVLSALLNGSSHVKWSPGFSLLSKAIGASPGLSVSTQNLGYSDAGLFTIQLTGPAVYVRKAAEEAVKALRSISEGSVSKEDLTKAIARAKFDALEASEARNASLLLAGSGLIQSGKPTDIASVIKPVESVTAEKLKAVRLALEIYFPVFQADIYRLYRRPRSFWMARPALPLSATCMCCLTPRSLDFGCRETRVDRASVYQQTPAGRRPYSSFVNIHGRVELAPFACVFEICQCETWTGMNSLGIALDEAKPENHSLHLLARLRCPNASPFKSHLKLAPGSYERSSTNVPGFSMSTTKNSLLTVPQPSRLSSS